jgi:hypothetical protein
MTETQARSESQAEAQTSKQQSAIQNEISLNHKLAEYDYANIRADKDLSEEGRRRKLQEAYDEHQAKHKAIVQKFEGQEQARRQELEREVFMMSLRDAVSRTNQTVTGAAKPSETLQRLYEQAVATGDEMLKYAAFRRAVESGFGPGNAVVSSYLAENALEEAFRIARAGDADVFDRALDMMGPPRPVELINRPARGRARGIA